MADGSDTSQQSDDTSLQDVINGGAYSAGQNIAAGLGAPYGVDGTLPVCSIDATAHLLVYREREGPRYIDQPFRPEAKPRITYRCRIRNSSRIGSAARISPAATRP